MTTLVLGANGATGRWLVRHLLKQGKSVRAVVRRKSSLPTDIRIHPNLEVVERQLTALSETEWQTLIRDCSAVTSCLGHNLNMQGLFRDPHRLVTETIQNTVRAIEANASTGRTKIVLMNSSGSLNQDAQEKRFRGERFVLFLLRYT